MFSLENGDLELAFAHQKAEFYAASDRINLKIE